MDNFTINSRTTGKPLPRRAYKAFTESYTRATEVILHLYNLSEDEAFVRVRRGPESWARYKFLVKAVHLHLWRATTNVIRAFLENKNNVALEYCDAAMAHWTAKRIRYCPRLLDMAKERNPDIVTELEKAYGGKIK